jgi:putative endonuclease
MSNCVEHQSSYKKGVNSENKGSCFLKRSNFSVLEQRYKTPFGEIDIVACKDKVLHFVEVKCRTTLDKARCAISKKQIRRIACATLFFLSNFPQYEQQNFEIQFDAIFVAENGVHFLEKAWNLEECELF